MKDDVYTTSNIIETMFKNFPDGTFQRNYISRWCNVTDRDMRKAVAELRKQGHLIVADESAGYRLAMSVEDVRRYTATLRSRITALAQVVKAMEAEAAKQFGDFEQLPLEI